MEKFKPEIRMNRHTLFQWFSPTELHRVLKVYPGETRLLLWVSLIQIVMSISSILINNVAQTTFLKRYGAESLPVVFLTEAVITFFFAGLVTLVMARFRSIRVFTGLLIFYGTAMGIVRLMVAQDMDLAYPLLYILKSQAAGILPILYWDILSDMFTTRQSKRLYTLISAGGIFGTSLGSLMTRRISGWIGIDNILVLFIAGMLITAVLNELTETVARIPVQARKRRQKKQTSENRWSQLKAFTGFARHSPLLTYLILLLAIPNMLLPILDYQFNIIVDAHFASETLTLQFFGIFRGISNAVIFLMLLVSNRFITKWGIPVSLLFHPVNYCFAFGLIFFNFTLVSGIYGRFTTEMIKTVLNNPARAVLYNFFPEEIRGTIRIVLRGGVVRAADFAGSGFLILMTGFIEPRMLSLAAVLLGLVWTITAFRLKKAYPGILLQTLEKGNRPWKTMEANQLRIMAADTIAVKKFKEQLTSDHGSQVMISGEFLASTRPDGWARNLIDSLPLHAPKIQQHLLELLKPEDIRPFIHHLYDMARSAPLESQCLWLESLVRLDPAGSAPFMKTCFQHPDTEIRTKAQELSALTAMTAQSLTGLLMDSGTKPLPPGMKLWAMTLLAARDTLLSPSLLATLLKDADPGVRTRAAELLKHQESESIPVLLHALADPSPRLRKESTRILMDLGTSSAHLSTFIMSTLDRAAHYLFLATQVERLEKSMGETDQGQALTLLNQCLREKQDQLLEVVLRVLGILEFKDRMDIILRAVQSKKQQDMDNAIELLETELHGDIARVLIPLLEKRPSSKHQRSELTCQANDQPGSDLCEPALKPFINDPDPTVTALGLCAMGETHDPAYAEPIRAQLTHSNSIIRQSAEEALHGLETSLGDRTLPLIEKLVGLKTNPLLGGIPIEVLLRTAGVCRKRIVPAGEVLIQKQEQNTPVILLLNGALSFQAQIFRNDFIPAGSTGESFAGEMFWIDGNPSLQCVKAVTQSEILELNGNDFLKLLEEFPAICINLCSIYSRYLRASHPGRQSLKESGCHD